VLRSISETGKPWTDLECEAVVSSYMEMRRAEVRGQPYSKTDAVRSLQAMLPVRSKGSIERKLQNVSAILDELDERWIDGYKPLPHYQHDLRRAVLGALRADHRIAEQVAEYESSPVPAPSGRRLATEDVLVDVPGSRARPARRTSVSLTGGSISAMHDFQRRSLGVAGEEWVLDLEREQLRRTGHDDLASAVRWVAREDGDGAGYDIRSFRTDGAERLIEVKTTNLGRLTPFYITRWEVDLSRERAERYSLYRVHGFNRDPRIYVLDGSVEEKAKLDPKVFLGIPF
jgi:Domain of unknown function (DUF3883)